MRPSPSSIGTLSVVSTPIGNLEDMTLRALRVLREADLIAAEDTRHTGNLLRHFGISTRLTSLHEHNEWARTAELLTRLESGAHIALVTDAGTPVVSDPGLHLIREARQHGVRVEPVPGPSAVMAALAGSGAVDGEFLYLGFPPRKKGERLAWFERLSDVECAMVLFEAPHRLASTLKDALLILGDRPLVVCRELTKIHEEFLDTTLSAAVDHFGAQDKIGEVTLVLPRITRERDEPGKNAVSDVETWRELCRMTDSGLGRREALSQLARRLGRSTRDTYSAAERGKLEAAGD